jgi:hypothetical protein
MSCSLAVSSLNCKKDPKITELLTKIRQKFKI